LPFSGEVDRVVGMRAQRLGQRLDERRHPPPARAVLTRGEHDLARVEHAFAALIADARAQQSVGGRLDRQQLDLVAHVHAGRAADPEQVVVPMRARDQAQAPPALRAEGGLVPGLVGEARHAEIGAVLVLGAAQRRHARVGHPRAFPAVGLPVDHELVVDAHALQREGRRHAALAGADDEHVQCVAAVRRLARREPGGARMRDRLQVAGHLRRERIEGGGVHAGGP
jgi:hypothetical protein